MNSFLNNFNGIFIVTLGIVLCVSKAIGKYIEENEEHSVWLTIVSYLIDWWIVSGFVTIMLFRTREYTIKKVAIVYVVVGIILLYVTYDKKYDLTGKVESQKEEVKKTKLYKFARMAASWLRGNAYEESEEAVKSNMVKRLYAYADCNGLSFLVDQEESDEIMIVIKNNTEDTMILQNDSVRSENGEHQKYTHTWLAELDYRHMRSVYSENKVLRLRPMEETSIRISRRITVDHEDPVVFFPSVLRLNLTENKLEEMKVLFPIVSYDIDPLMAEEGNAVDHFMTINSDENHKQVNNHKITMSIIRALLRGEKVVMKLDNREYEVQEMFRINLREQVETWENVYMTLYLPEYENAENAEAVQERGIFELKKEAENAEDFPAA